MNKLVFTKLSDSGEVKSLISQFVIIPPHEVEGYEYYYPDGITKGFFNRKTYFIKGKGKYFEDPTEIINSNPGLTTKDGKICEHGTLRVIIPGLSETPEFHYTEEGELRKLLNNLTEDFGIYLRDYILIDTPKVKSLYEYKEGL